MLDVQTPTNTLLDLLYTKKSIIFPGIWYGWPKKYMKFIVTCFLTENKNYIRKKTFSY